MNTQTNTQRLLMGLVDPMSPSAIATARKKQRISFKKSRVSILKSLELRIMRATKKQEWIERRDKCMNLFDLALKDF